MRITLPDDLADRLDSEAARVGLPADLIATRHLQRSILYPLRDRLLILTAEDRRALEAELGPLKDPAALIKAVAAMHTFAIQGVKIPLDQWQLEEIHRKAEKNGTSVKAEIEVMVKAVQDLVFSGLHA